MDDFFLKELTQQAARKIAAVLQQLELDADTNVDGISLSSYDFTTLQDPQMQRSVSVNIDLRRKIGTRWQT